jgi:hypothetical protein
MPATVSPHDADDDRDHTCESRVRQDHAERHAMSGGPGTIVQADVSRNNNPGCHQDGIWDKSFHFQ